MCGADERVVRRSAERLGLYERLVHATPGLERKGATMPYTSLKPKPTTRRA
jgi:hypothetical protein